MEKPEENIVNTGIVFMFTAWIQGQMSDLIIFKKHPELIPDFIANPKKLPSDFRDIRVRYWEKQFTEIKTEFVDLFSNVLTNEEKSNAEEIYHLRNVIAHVHVSIGRDYMLYRPHGGKNKEQKLIDDLKIQPIDDQAEPLILKLELWRKDNFHKASNLMERFDQITLKKVADSVGIPHGRIR